MITRCAIPDAAAESLRAAAGLAPNEPVASAELEFREVPYFIVSRSREKWGEDRGDINAIRLVGANDRGLLADPDNASAAEGVPARVTLIPWTNVVSLTVLRKTGEGN